MTTVLVLGKTGQVGFELMRAQWPDGVEVIGTDRTSVDFTEPSTITSAIQRIRPDVIVNAAAYTQVDKAESERDLAFQVNAVSVGALAQAAAAIGAPVLHISTDYVFDGSGIRPWREDDPTAPLGNYGASKRAGEVALATAQPRSFILRTSWVYGVHGHNFAKTMLRLGHERDELSVVADQFGAPTAASDIAAALVVMATAAHSAKHNMEQPWGIYHFAGAGETTWHGFADQIFVDMERRSARRPRCNPITTSDYPTAAQRPSNSRLDCTKFEATFGLKTLPWQKSLERVLGELAGG